MHRPKIYLDTSVISHLHQLDVPEKMNDTLALWEDLKRGLYDICISDVVLDEITQNSPTKQQILFQYLAEITYATIKVDHRIRVYADKLIEEGVLTEKSRDDCLHIASAVVSQCNMILSWNFKHIVKVKTVNGVRSINAMLGYHGIDIFPPSMLVERGS